MRCHQRQLAGSIWSLSFFLLFPTLVDTGSSQFFQQQWFKQQKQDKSESGGHGPGGGKRMTRTKKGNANLLLCVLTTIFKSIIAEWQSRSQIAMCASLGNHPRSQLLILLPALETMSLILVRPEILFQAQAT